jgi:hypothetical protein
MKYLNLIISISLILISPLLFMYAWMIVLMILIMGGVALGGWCAILIVRPIYRFYSSCFITSYTVIIDK